MMATKVYNKMVASIGRLPAKITAIKLSNKRILLKKFKPVDTQPKLEQQGNAKNFIIINNKLKDKELEE